MRFDANYSPPAGRRKIVYQHSTAKSFSILHYTLPIRKENTVYGAHIVAVYMSKIMDDVVFDCNRVGVPLCKVVEQLL